MEKNNNGDESRINDQELEKFIFEINAENSGIIIPTDIQFLDEDEEYIAYMSEYIEGNIPEILDILEAFPSLIPEDIDISNIVNELIKFVKDTDSDMEVSYPPSKKEMYFDNIMSILKARDFLRNDYNDKEQNIVFARESLSDLISNKVYTAKEKLEWLDMAEYITDFNPMSLGPTLFEQELDFLSEMHSKLSEDYYFIHTYLQDLERETLQFLNYKYGDSVMAEEIAEELIDLIRPLEDIFRVYNAIKNNPKEFKVLRYKFYDDLNDLELDIYELAENYIPEDELSMLIMKIGDQYLSFLKELSELDIEYESPNEDPLED